MRLEWLLLFIALAAFTYNYVHQQPITLSFDVKNPLAPEETTLVAGAKTELGPLKLSYSASWGRSLSSRLSFDLDIAPPQLPYVKVQFTTDSLQGILVRKGQMVEEGQLIGFHSVKTQQEIAKLEENLETTEDELIRAELRKKIEELREQNEVHVLVSGYVESLWVEQIEGDLIAHLKVVLVRPNPSGVGMVRATGREEIFPGNPG